MYRDYPIIGRSAFDSSEYLEYVFLHLVKLSIRDDDFLMMGRHVINAYRMPQEARGRKCEKSSVGWVAWGRGRFR